MGMIETISIARINCCLSMISISGYIVINTIKMIQPIDSLFQYFFLFESYVFMFACLFLIKLIFWFYITIEGKKSV